MKLSELHRLVSAHHKPDQPHLDMDVMIAVKLPYVTVGAIPMVKVHKAMAGIDWEAGHFILSTTEDLQPANRDFTAQFKDMQQKYGWLEYENRNLKAEVARLRKKIKEFTAGMSDDDFKNDKYA